MTSTAATQDSKALSGATKAGRSNSNGSNNNNHDNRGNHSSERAGNKATLTDTTMDTKDTTPLRSQNIADKSRPVSSPGAMPKSILRISSPDGYKRPRPLSSHGLTSDAAPPGLAPSPHSLPSPSNTITVKDPPSTTPPPSPPITRPMSPGTTVRFAKATIHRVEVGPGRRFMPVKRKSKSTLTYISPLDPGTQRGAPKTMLQSPTKLRRHQENQAAMGRYWLRTEEEEAQWRAEAEKRAEEEAERYRNEPASPPPSTSSGASVSGDSDGGGGLASKVKDIDKLPLLNKNGPALDKVEEEEAESEDGDEEAGARCDAEPEAEAEPVPSKRAEMEVRTTKESMPESRGLIVATKPAVLDSPVSAIPETPATRPSESKSFSQRLADKRKEAEVRAVRTTTVPTTTFAHARAASPSSSSGESSGSARSSSSFLAQQPPRTSTTNINLVNTQPSNLTRIDAVTAPETPTTPATSATPIITPAPIRQQLTRSPSRRASRLLSRPSSRSPANSPCSSRSSSCSSSRSFVSSEKDKTTQNENDTPTSPRENHAGTYHPQLQHAHITRPLSLSSPRSTMSLRASSSSSSSGGSSSGTEEPRSRMYVSRSISHGNMNLSGGSRGGMSEESATASWSSGGGSGVNHLHLSGRRGSRRFLEDHKEGIVA
ncbi:uncharacterized protein C8A04DRAFT_23808 [Dichotomopilus funicola]|uniref:Uncharacterized protein n=1 Tax=Dichotomopilus funicola TaxID=1934379 RepID=A0AAN6VBQ9_9PEZI|nr:hypothetical protein C8A04DRAFT_23808 [Dichotomopilus funicola]